MEKKKTEIEHLLIKLQVLDSKIQNLDSITDGIMKEVNTQYRTQIKELVLKKETIQQKLKDIQGISNDA